MLTEPDLAPRSVVDISIVVTPTVVARRASLAPKEVAVGDQAGACSVSPPDRAVAPPFDPDPKLIDHLEGNQWSRRGYREEAEKLRRKSQA